MSRKGDLLWDNWITSWRGTHMLWGWGCFWNRPQIFSPLNGFSPFTMKLHFLELNLQIWIARHASLYTLTDLFTDFPGMSEHTGINKVSMDRAVRMLQGKLLRSSTRFLCKQFWTASLCESKPIMVLLVWISELVFHRVALIWIS